MKGMPPPSKIVGIERNYGDNASPRFFLRPPTCIIGPDEQIIIPSLSGQVIAQCEVGVVIGKAAQHISPEDVKTHIAAYTCVTDVTALDLFRQPESHAIAKWFDTFMPLGPRLVTTLPPGGATMTCSVNGEVALEGHTSELHLALDTLISRLSQIMTLLPGDIVMSGGPPGAPIIRPGDAVEVRVEGVGRLRNPVAAAAA